jgi:peptidoglycan/xylan/chitin deacetylase (PgdA/CDA1 family)
VEIERGTAARREMAFTFDCAANSGPTDEILRVLREENVRVTWFMVGLWVKDHQELTKVIAREHELANHSWAHPDYRDLTAAEIAADMEELDRYLIALTGKGTKPLWRAPSGARDQRVLEAAAAAGWPLHIFWTIGQDARGTVTGDTGDWRGIPASEVWANTVRAAGLGPGVITVSHCDAPSTAAVMRDTIRLFRDQGLKIVTVSELLRP